MLGGVSANEPTDATYNVFLDLPADVTQPGTDDPRYVGTLNFFGASGDHGHSSGGHRSIFNVTNTMRDLQAKAQLGATPNVTLVRRGAPAEKAKPTIAQIVLIES